MHDTNSCDIEDNTAIKNSVISNTRGFKMGALNVNGLLTHIDELKIFMCDKPFDILAINETKLDKNISDAQINIPGYICFRRDRDRHGGGVCIYAKTSSIVINRKLELENDSLEMLCIEVKQQNSTVCHVFFSFFFPFHGGPVITARI